MTHPVPANPKRRRPRPRRIQTFAELLPILESFLATVIFYVIIFVVGLLVLVGLYRLTDVLLLALLSPLAQYRVYVEVSLAVFGTIKLLISGHGILEVFADLLLESTTEQDETHAVPETNQDNETHRIGSGHPAAAGTAEQTRPEPEHPT